jgi:hypothetical protein
MGSMVNFDRFSKLRKATHIPAGKISAGFVPHEDFHRFKWLQPEATDTKWYYRVPHRGNIKIPNNPNFYHTLDPELKDIVQGLHSAGIATTPSCSGHFHDKSVYEDLFMGLSESCEIIKDKGVVLVDPEDGREYFYKNSHYKLPWEKTEFVNKSIEHGMRGVLGMHDPSKKIYRRLEKSEIPNSELKRDGEITIFLTVPEREFQIRESWKALKEALSSENYPIWGLQNLQ